MKAVLLRGYGDVNQLFHGDMAPLFLKKYVEEGVVNPNLAVVFDEAQFPEAIHEETHTRSGRADHLS